MENNAINEMRERAGWTITALSRNLGMPYKTAQNYCNGYRQCPEWVAKLVCDEIRRQAGIYD